MRTTWRRLPAAFFLLDGIGILAIWALSLRDGAFAQGLLAFQDGNYPLLHLTAESLMGVLAIVAGLGLWRGAAWGRGMALLASGALAYSAINSAGWALYHDPVLAVPMAVTLLGVLLTLPHLLRAEK